MLRLFVALALPEWVKDDLERLQAGVPGARWVEREQMHLTLRFIGEVDRGTFRDVATMLENDFAQCRRVTLDEVSQRPMWKKVVSRAAYLMAPVQ